MPLRNHDACSASESPQCPGGEMERARGPQMNSRKRAGIIHSDRATHFQFKVFVLTSFFPDFFFFFLFLPFFTCLLEGWFPVSPPVAESLGSWAFVSWKKSAQASDQPLLVLRRI